MAEGAGRSTKALGMAEKGPGAFRMEFRQIPKHPAYRITIDGKLKGHLNRFMRPCLRASGAASTMYYSLITGNTSSKILVRTLVKAAWGVTIEPDLEWYDSMRATIDANGGKAEPKMEEVACSVCGEMFERLVGLLRDTCTEECRTEKRKRTIIAKALIENAAERLEYTETGCQEFRSWDCPEMLPLEWVDLPVAVRVNVKPVKKMEVAA